MANTRDPELVILLNSIAISCKLISSAVSRAGVAKLYGLAGEVNSTGDDQKKLDVLSNDMMINALVHSGVCSVLVSEENEEPIFVSKFTVPQTEAFYLQMSFTTPPFRLHPNCVSFCTLVPIPCTDIIHHTGSSREAWEVLCRF
jgi:hypothetical protein